MKKKLKKMADFKEVKVNTPKRVVAGAAYTTMNGKENGDYTDGDWLYDYAEDKYYYACGDGHYC